MKRTMPFLLGLVLAAGCTPAKRDPDAIRHETARATSEAARDAKAVAQGVVDGLKQKSSVDINHASSDDLAALPGLDNAAAHRIVKARPYDDTSDLYKRHVISKAQYDRIADHVVAH